MNPPETQAVAVHETIITPPRSWSWPINGELWEYRDLIYFLTKRELQIRYKQSFFGVGWAVLQPLALAFIFALIFGTLIKTPSVDIPYPVFAVGGLVPWLFFSQAVMMGANSLVLDSDLISKVYFPRISLPFAKALSLIVDLGISFVVVIAVALIYGVGISSNIWALPGFMVLGMVTTFALGALLAAINVKYRDVQLVLPMLIQVLLFISPVVYPGSLVTGDWRYVYALNPMVSVLDGIRWALFDTTSPGGVETLISVASALVLLFVSMAYFRRTEHYFADIV